MHLSSFENRIKCNWFFVFLILECYSINNSTLIYKYCTVSQGTCNGCITAVVNSWYHDDVVHIPQNFGYRNLDKILPITTVSRKRS